MTATLAEVRTALAETLADVTGLRTYDFMPDQFACPCIAVLPLGWVPISFQQGSAQYEFALIVRVQSTSERAGQLALDDFITPVGATSIWAALYADPTLGGVVHDCGVSGMRDYGFASDGDATRYFQATIDVTVLTSGV